MKTPDVIATLEILQLALGQPGVRLCASDEFLDIPPPYRAVLLAAVIQVCEAAIEAICQDHPDDEDEIRETLSAVMVEPSTGRLN